ncbi:hypothetical protein [Leadbetterella sp. DM7]|uniref:hypothetical protein n=1 Tax=Leadbetterella sp. DM7 TaxID=3235085 RepID=UPI00349ED227
MTTIRVDILNPKAVRLLRDLADLNLISIKKEEIKKGFAEILEKLRSDISTVPGLDEITAEVEKVRTKRYEQ